jgi:NAD(P)-dependent dehydrogenase (short-subunit alcohol dehydrogenase family)
VTGASTGIGEATALHLRSLGFSVVAGVRKEADAKRLRARDLTPLMLEVTDPDSVAAAAAEVEALVGADGLAGLVNNAGIALAAPIEFLPIDELRQVLEINLIGQVAVTQALLPMLRIAQGRVVNIGSIAGRVALPLMGAYAASKFALEGVSDSLRRELYSQRVEVVVIEPGGIKTPIWEKGVATAERMADALPPEGERLYGSLIATMREQSRRIAEERGQPASDVAAVVAAALTAARPRTRYVVGRDARLRAAVARRLPDRLVDWLVLRALRP